MKSNVRRKGLIETVKELKERLCSTDGYPDIFGLRVKGDVFRSLWKFKTRSQKRIFNSYETLLKVLLVV